MSHFMRFGALETCPVSCVVVTIDFKLLVYSDGYYVWRYTNILTFCDVRRAAV